MSSDCVPNLGLRPADASEGRQQGGRDYLGGPVQWEGWERTLGNNRAVTRHLLPDLNHMMQAGTGKMRPDEYGERRPVDAGFTDLLADWIKGSDLNLQAGEAGNPSLFVNALRRRVTRAAAQFA